MNTSIPLILIVGGARSGKSSYGETIALTLPSPRRYLATAERIDVEMENRIAIHRKQREGRFSGTVEEPLHPGRVITSVGDGMIYLDCLTVFLGNLMHYTGLQDSYEQLEELYSALEDRKVPLVVISNLVGEGIVPADRLSRAYRDMHGLMNQRVASMATTMIRMTCGIPQVLKGSL
ncbi:MAG: bifunctional adenosylcobinamide kinase/adenosylcobinamide-phosphate guanylyltransferase [Sphaerochaetaceae bacterium]|nr:bifunctional adenosylcobinamide kinase/adenosylcobinamide-phosphate guanylyltransferase [Sphaerochaetaceae bacterium]